MIDRSIIENVVDELKRERNNLSVKKYDFQAIGLRKAIDKLHEILDAHKVG